MTTGTQVDPYTTIGIRIIRPPAGVETAAFLAELHCFGGTLHGHIFSGFLVHESSDGRRTVTVPDNLRSIDEPAKARLVGKILDTITDFEMRKGDGAGAPQVRTSSSACSV